MANDVLTTNTDIDYIEKDFNSTVDALITFANINYGPGTTANRLWTDFNADSFSRTWLEIVAYIADVFFFYLDNQATQSYLQTATIRSAVENIADQFGFVPATATSASGVVTFTATGAGSDIPRGFKLQSTSGEDFFVTNDVSIPGAGEYDATVLHGAINNESFIAEGLQNEEFELSADNVIRDTDNSNSSDITPQVTVSGNSYTLVDTFIWQDGSDTSAITDSLGNVIGGGGRVYILKERDNGTPYIRFGDGEFGRKLSSGEVVSIAYRSGGGSAGNVSKGNVTVLVDTNTAISSVTNDSDFSGGADEQSIDRLRELIPASLRTLERAVSEQDYSDILKANFNSVFDATTEQNKKDPGIDLNVYVIPSGSGIASITDNIVLYNQLIDFLNRRKMVTVQYSILDAYGIDYIIELEIFVGNTISRSTTIESINTALENFFDLDSGGSDGSGMGFAKEVLIKDIMNVIEEIDGITRFEIKKLTYRPRIDEDVVSGLTSYNNSAVTIFNNVTESEWLNVASGLLSETYGTVLFTNNSSPRVAFTYTSGTGVVQYAIPIDLSLVAPGDFFRDSADVDWPILGVDTLNYNITLDEGLAVDDSAPSTDDHGSIRNGSTEYESFKCFRKTLATTTNLSESSITDNNLDLSVVNGTCVSLDDNLILDNSKVFVHNKYATGDYYLVDASDNIWSISSNDSNTITTGPNAINDSAIMEVTAGDYDIVQNLTGYQVVFNENIFNVQYNTKDTLFSVSAQFSQIGTIGDDFEIAKPQSNIGVLGESLDLLSTSSGSLGETEIQLNSTPDLTGISAEWVVIDSDGQIFNIVGVDDRQQPIELYDSPNKSANFLLEGSGAGNQVGQGFQVPETSAYAAVSLYLRREGNIQGNLVLRIVNDDGGGLPDFSSIIATSIPIDVANIETGDIGMTNLHPSTESTIEVFSSYTFTFVVPPTLTASTTYHIVLEGDGTYDLYEVSGNVLMTSAVSYTYNSSTGVVSYSSSVDLSVINPGNYFEDDDGDLFLILSVDDDNDEIVIATDQTALANGKRIFTAGSNSRVLQNDRILIGIDNSSPTYGAAGIAFSSYDGFSWSYVSPDSDAIFVIEGTKSITIESNLTPTLGTGATVSKRYYDDDNEVSFILGLASGTPTSATDANAAGNGTVSGEANTTLDTFVFRTTRISDDIINLRLNEVPQISTDDINILIYGGVE